VSGGPGRVVLVLHTHLPYVEGFGTWPFGEEWLWEAVATSYRPLLGVLARHPLGDRVTVSVTPVLGDQLAAPDVARRYRTFLDDVREDVFAREIDGLSASGAHGAARALEVQRETYRAASRAVAGAASARSPADLTGGLLARADWTSSATHAVLPVLATDEGVTAQLRVGIDAHRRRAGRPWRGGLWLPECAYDPSLDDALGRAGVRAACVDLTDPLGHGTDAQLRPYATGCGTTLLPLDRTLMDLVWADGAIPAAGAYRDSHRRTTFDLMPWSNDGRAWDPDRARERAVADAAAFVAAARERLAGGGVATVAMDTEFLGHWWLEGPWWLQAVLDELHRDGPEPVLADDAAAGVDPAPLPSPARTTTTWGARRSLWTWSNPGVADRTARMRRAELDVVARGPAAPVRAWRELLALQSSDWAFLHTRGTAGDYPDVRADGHAEALDGALAALGSPDPSVRNLAPFLDAATPGP